MQKNFLKKSKKSTQPFPGPFPEERIFPGNFIVFDKLQRSLAADQAKNNLIVLYFYNNMYG